MPPKTAAKKKPAPKKVAAKAPAQPAAKAPAKRGITKKSTLLGKSLLPGVTPPMTPPPEAPKKPRSPKSALTIKHIEITPAQVEEFRFDTSLDPALFQRTKRSTGKVPLPVNLDPRLWSAISRYNPRKGGVSNFCNQAVARWLQGNLDKVLLATLNAQAMPSAPRTVILSLDPDLATRLKAAVQVLKSKGFAKASIAGLILGCASLQATDLKLMV